MKKLDLLDAIGTIVVFDYVNWKGVRSSRTVRVIRFYYGTSEYHYGPQFFMHGYDLDRDEKRDFAMQDITSLKMREGWAT